MSTEFGIALKEWRRQRRVSQLDLGLNANVSARHISFLETGRAKPSRSMVMQLCDELDVPRLSRNQMLTAAGLAPGYVARELSDQDMKPVRRAVDWMLDRHAPFPAIALDRHWTVIKTNHVAGMLMAGVGINEGESLLQALLSNSQLQAAVENFDEVVDHLITRLRTESAHFGGDVVLDEALKQLTAMRGNKESSHNGILPAFVPTRYRVGDTTLSLFSTFSQFGTAEDIALCELRIELMFPADEATHQQLLQF